MPIGSEPVDAPVFAEQISAVRIDEAGLRAMAWCAQEQAQATESINQIHADETIVGSPVELFIPTRSDVTVISRSKRSA